MLSRQAPSSKSNRENHPTQSSSGRAEASVRAESCAVSESEEQLSLSDTHVREVAGLSRQARVDASKTRAVDLGLAWRELREGRLRVTGSLCSNRRCYLTLEGADPERTEMVEFVREHLWLVERVLLGERQKVMAIEQGVSASTMAATLRRCLRVVGVDCRFQRVPLLLVMVANACLRAECAAQGSLTPQRGEHSLLLGAACPDVGVLEALGDEEAAVTRLWLEGKTHREIAELRRRSPHTVANQLAATYEKLGVSGRFELVGRLMAHARPSTETR